MSLKLKIPITHAQIIAQVGCLLAPRASESILQVSTTRCTSWRSSTFYIHPGTSGQRGQVCTSGYCWLMSKLQFTCSCSLEAPANSAAAIAWFLKVWKDDVRHPVGLDVWCLLRAAWNAACKALDHPAARWREGGTIGHFLLAFTLVLRTLFLCLPSIPSSNRPFIFKSPWFIKCLHHHINNLLHQFNAHY